LDSKGSGLKEQVLLAALRCSDGSCEKPFTIEDLLVCAWKKEKSAWGLRGYETEYPDADKIHKELDSRGLASKGIVGLGYLEKVHHRVYRLTPAGLMASSTLRSFDPVIRERAGRRLEQAIKQILEHPVFRMWLKDPALPTRFRDAGHFWGIAPGMPSQTVRKRVDFVEWTLKAASDFLNGAVLDGVSELRGKVLFQREDIERGWEFHESLKKRFSRDLAILDSKVK
jgi:hypothetical protein